MVSVWTIHPIEYFSNSYIADDIGISFLKIRAKFTQFRECQYVYLYNCCDLSALLYGSLTGRGPNRRINLIT